MLRQSRGCRASLQRIAEARAQGALMLAAERLRDASQALPEHLTPLLVARDHKPAHLVTAGSGASGAAAPSPQQNISSHAIRGRSGSNSPAFDDIPSSVLSDNKEETAEECEPYGRPLVIRSCAEAA